MFLKQYNYKPRSNSQSSASGEAAKQEALVQETAAQAQQDNAGASTGTSGRRRSSADPKFAGLTDYKRNSMSDKREAYSDQASAQPGVLGQMWSNFTKGK